MQQKKSKKEALTSPKGMNDIIGEEYYRYQGFFEKAAEIAIYYGFNPIETPILEKEAVFTSGVGEGTDIIEKEMYSLKTKGGTHLAMRPEGTAGVMRSYIENGMQSLPQPVMLYYYGPFFRHERPQKGRLRELRQFGLEILGTPKSIADAMVIQIITIILKESGFKNPTVDINSIGDKECRPAYVKSLIAYYKKHINSICDDCRQRMKTSPLRVLDCKNEKCQPIKEGAPDSITALCVECRAHFKEVLEYLEMLKVPYRINNHLVRGLDYYTKTVFEIFDDSEQKEPTEKTSKTSTPLTIAGGGRYDTLAKNLASKKDVSAIGASIGVDRLLSAIQCKQLNPRILKKPKIYFIQIGFEAKLKSLGVIEVLRKAKIPIKHSLSKDSLSSQLAVAEKLEIPLTIIFGQKEALENSVIVRNMQTRSQETIYIKDLAEHLKKTK